MTVRNVMFDYGAPDVPRDVKRLRANLAEALRSFGAPAVIKHKFNAQDVDDGLAIESPNRSTTFRQSRHNDPLSFGTGFVSVEVSDDEWVSPDLDEVVTADDAPGDGWTPAPLYRGYGLGHLIYVVEPDRAEDLFKLTETGAFIKVQNAVAQAPWYPEINDNDLLINVELGRDGRILRTHERYEAKQSSPTSIRGRDRRGAREYSEDGGNRFVVRQRFEMALIPPNDILQQVPVDR